MGRGPWEIRDSPQKDMTRVLRRGVRKESSPMTEFVDLTSVHGGKVRRFLGTTRGSVSITDRVVWCGRENSGIQDSFPRVLHTSWELQLTLRSGRWGQRAGRGSRGSPFRVGHRRGRIWLGTRRERNKHGAGVWLERRNTTVYDHPTSTSNTETSSNLWQTGSDRIDRRVTNCQEPSYLLGVFESLSSSRY